MPRWWGAKEFSNVVFIVIAVLSLVALMFLMSEELVVYLQKTGVISIWTK